METLFRWLAKMLAGILERYADPQLEANLKAFELKAAAAKAKEQESIEQTRLSEIAYAESEQRRKQLDRDLAESLRLQAVDQRLLAESEARRKALRDELNKAEADIDSRTDDDLIFSGVPKSNNPPKA